MVLQPQAESAQVARRVLARQHLTEDQHQIVALLATELNANAVRHADLGDDERLVVVTQTGEGFVRVEVTDPGTGFDPQVVARGLGLRLLDLLASRWGVRREQGCSVWFELDRRPHRFERV